MDVWRCLIEEEDRACSLYRFVCLVVPVVGEWELIQNRDDGFYIDKVFFCIWGKVLKTYPILDH